MFRRRKCIDCGYLCDRENYQKYLGEQTLDFGVTMPQTESVVQYHEITSKERQFEIDDIDHIHCFRHQASFDRELELVKSADELHEVQVPKYKEIIMHKRACEFFTHHLSGYGPAQQMARNEVLERERSNRLWNLFWLLAGVALTAAATWILSLFQSNGV